jgi:hypothetical protein
VELRGRGGAHLEARAVVGGAPVVRGTYDTPGVLRAETRAKASPARWEPDR